MKVSDVASLSVFVLYARLIDRVQRKSHLDQLFLHASTTAFLAFTITSLC